MVLGAILGDIIGSPYEFDTGNTTKDFKLFNDWCMFTDDTVMTIAIMKAILDRNCEPYFFDLSKQCVKTMRELGNKYIDVGYGNRFYDWLCTDNPKPYNSYGNGSAMRVSPVGWAYETMFETRLAAQATSIVTHDHLEGIKGAECTASVIYLARKNYSKEAIKDYVIKEFGYDLSKTVDELRPLHIHDESCQDSLPKALASFFEGESYEDTVRNAVSLGGDTDTVAAIAGSMAEAMYGIPENIQLQGMQYLPKDLLHIIVEFNNILADRKGV